MNLLWISDMDLPAASREELSHDGGAVVAARGGAGGIAAASGSRFDAVVIHAPLDGWSVREIAEEVHRRNAIAPVLVIAGEDQPGPALPSVKAGIHSVLPRGASVGEIRTAVTKALEQRPNRETAF